MEKIKRLKEAVRKIVRLLIKSRRNFTGRGNPRW
jgi:hypothetical protein